MGALVTLKDLRVFRGTYAEIKDRPTEDKMVYLAWDTQELFIGNARGVKVKYGGVKNLENLLAEAFASFREEVYQTVDTYASTKVEGVLEETTSALNTKINTDITALKDEEDAKINSLAETVDTLSTNTTSRFNSMSSMVSEVANTTNTLTTNISNVTNRVDELEQEANINFSYIGSQGRSIENLQTSVSGLQTSVSTLEGTLENVQFNTILYGTGQAIANNVTTLTAANKLNTFIPTLCVSEYGDYLAGSIYYFNGSQIVASASGGSGMIEHLAEISAELINFNSSYELNTGDKVGKVLITVSGDESAIVSYSVALLKNGVQVVGYENLVNGQNVVLSTSEEAIYSLRITAVSTENTSAHRYTVSTSVGSNIQVYIPVITNVKFVSNNTTREFNFIGTYTNIPIEAEETLYIYSTQVINRIVFNGGLVDEELDFTSEVCDLPNYQYKYNLGSTWFDTNLPSITLS